MNFTDALAYIASFLVLLTFSMKTMVRLRIIGILSNVFFIGYGYLDHAMPILILHLILLPLNVVRLMQMRALVRRIDEATQGNLNMDWLRSVTQRRLVKAGDYLFRKDDEADSMMFVVSGGFHIAGIGIDIRPGDFIGEMGLVAPNKRRTQTVQCIADGELLVITYDQVKMLYFQNPGFGFFFLNLITQRLFANHGKIEDALKRTSPGDASSLSGQSMIKV